jgi:hypothetical protein
VKCIMKISINFVMIMLDKMFQWRPLIINECDSIESANELAQRSPGQNLVKNDVKNKDDYLICLIETCANLSEFFEPMITLSKHN